MNNYQKKRFAQNMVKTMFNTVSGKKIAMLGWAFKKDTNDSRESAAIDVAAYLLEEQAVLHIYDPKVTKEKIITDIEYITGVGFNELINNVVIHNDTETIFDRAHAIAVLTEWNEFSTYNYNHIKCKMLQPAFVFDGRNILNSAELKGLGFFYHAIGK